MPFYIYKIGEEEVVEHFCKGNNSIVYRLNSGDWYIVDRGGEVKWANGNFCPVCSLFLEISLGYCRSNNCSTCFDTGCLKNKRRIPKIRSEIDH